MTGLSALARLVAGQYSVAAPAAPKPGAGAPPPLPGIGRMQDLSGLDADAAPQTPGALAPDPAQPSAVKQPSPSLAPTAEERAALAARAEPSPDRPGAERPAVASRQAVRGVDAAQAELAGGKNQPGTERPAQKTRKTLKPGAGSPGLIDMVLRAAALPRRSAEAQPVRPQADELPESAAKAAMDADAPAGDSARRDATDARGAIDGAKRAVEPAGDARSLASTAAPAATAAAAAFAAAAPASPKVSIGRINIQVVAPPAPKPAPARAEPSASLALRRAGIGRL